MKKQLLTLATALALSTPIWADALPYSQSFDSQSDFSTMTLWHATTDSRNWDYSSTAARFYPGARYNSYNAWFFTPSLDLEAGKTYVITFKTRISSSGSSNYKDLYVSYGTECTPESQTQAWMENIQSTSYVEKKLTINPDATGAYNIGFHTEASSGSINDILVDDILIKEYISLPGKATDLTATPGEKGVLSVTLSWTNPSVNDGGSALDQLSGVKIYRTDSSYVVMGENNLIATVTDGITTGQTSTWTDNTIDKPGTYYYNIVPFNNNGDSPLTPEKIKTAYVGPDTNIGATKNVVASLVEGNDKAVTLTWDAPTGTNGGYIDPVAVTWKITRKGNETVVLEEAWSGQPPYVYTDETLTGLDAYTYTVQSIYEGKTETSGSASNVIAAGGTAALPYTDSFSESSISPLYTQIGGTWMFSSYAGYPYTSAKDVWLITPPFELKKGVAYDIDYQTWVSSASYPRQLALTVGKEANAEAHNDIIANDNVNITSSSNAAAKKSVRYIAEEDGVAYFGFHASSSYSSGNVYLDNISIKEVKVVPEAAKNFTATPDEDGELSVTLSWTNPSIDNLGNALTSIDKIEIYRGDVIIKKYVNAEPGKEMTLTDEGIEKAGVYTYKIIAYLGQNPGEEATASSGPVGGAISLPYTPDFSNAESFELWPMPANSQGDKWSYNASYSRLETPDADDLWLFTPKFSAQRGTVTLKINAAIRSSYYSETITVALYKDASTTAEALTEPQTIKFTSTNKTNAEVSLDIAEEGKYHIGIYRAVTGYSLYLYGASIEQTAVINLNAPLAATNLTADGDTEDESKVNLSWTNPTQTVGGTELSGITKIEVLRNGEVIATLDGNAESYVDTLDEAGKYTYSVIAYNGEDASEPASATTGFVGGAFDLPYSPDFSQSSTFDVWTFVPNEDEKVIKYNSSNDYLESYASNVTVETPAFKAKKGIIDVAVTAKTTSYRYPTKLTVNVLSQSDEVVETADYEFTNSSWPETEHLEATIPTEGKYRVQIIVTNSGNGTFIEGLEVEQTSVVEPITIWWDNTDACYSTPAVSVDGGAPVAMTCVWDGTMPSAVRHAARKIFEKDAFYAEIPNDAKSVKFLDADNPEMSVEIENPEHNRIYKADGTSDVYNPDDVTAIESVISESADAPVFFNLQGIRVAHPAAGQPYIVVRAGKVTKEIVK